MTISTFYASTAIEGVSLGGNSTINTDALIAIYNLTNSTTQVVIKNLYWTFISGKMGASNLIWVQGAQSTPLRGKRLTPLSIGNVATSACEVYTGKSVFKSTPSLIRPSTISFNNSLFDTVEAFNFNEFSIAAGFVIGVSAVGEVGIDDKSIITVVWQETS